MHSESRSIYISIGVGSEVDIEGERNKLRQRHWHWELAERNTDGWMENYDAIVQTNCAQPLMVRYSTVRDGMVCAVTV